MAHRRRLQALVRSCTLLVLLLSAPGIGRAQGEIGAPTPETGTVGVTATAGTETFTPSPSAALEDTATPSETATQTDTPILSPTGTEETVTPTLENSATPSETRTQTATPSPSPTEATATTSATASATATGTAEAITLALTPTPQFITPGGSATLHWTITGIDPASHALSLTMSLPAGIEPKAGEGTFDGGSRTLAIAAGSTTGQFHLSISEEADDTSFDVSLVEGSATLANTAVTILTHEEFLVGRNGGTINAVHAKVKITFPAGALAENAKITVARPQSGASRSGHAFEITAMGLQSNSDIHQFDQEVTIAAQYADFGVAPGRESQTYVWWYDPDAQAWSALPSQAEADTGTVTATTDHFSTFDISVNDWEAARMPTVDAFQVSRFTGAGTFSLPIDAPDGPGGLKPDLTLTYNSQVVDQASFETEPGWVGMGWSLDTGQIDLDDHGTDTTSDDSWLLNAGGVSTRIVKNTDGYHATDEDYWKITYDATTDAWTVWDKTGDIYYFETISEFSYGGSCGSASDAATRLTYRWSLSRVRNIFGQELTYSYIKATKCVGTNHIYQSDSAIYPDTILYPGGRQRVRFVNESRGDYPVGWDSDGADHVYQKSRLKQIYIEEEPPGATAFSVRRQYVFTYAADTDPNVISPNHTYTAGNKDSTLLSVQMLGTTGSGLPPYTFSYADHMHLTGVNNGYGGSAGLTYDAQPWAASATTAWRTKSVGFARAECTAWGGDIPSEAGNIVCYGGAMTVKNNATASRPNFVGNELLRPGGAYSLTANLSVPLGSGNAMRIGVDFGTSQSWATCVTGQSTCSGTVYAPGDASKADPMIQVTNGSADVNGFTYKLMPSFYRVAQESIGGGGQGPYVFSYAYSGAAVNDSSNSPCAAPCTRFFELYTEFRGHASMTETGPDGRNTVRTFGQASDTRGLPLSVTVKNGSGVAKTQTIYTYASAVLPVSSPSGFNDVQRYWTPMSTREDRIYQADGVTYSATQDSYTYDGYGNPTAAAESSWNGSGWNLYRMTTTDYFPNAPAGGSIYLVGLPARRQVKNAGGTVLAESLSLYDGANTYNSLPTAGKLTAMRTLTLGTSYSQATLGYDAWGNTSSVTTYSGSGTASSAPASGARTTSTTFDSAYHAYPTDITQPLMPAVHLNYDYIQGVPLSETDANGQTTSATYDAFGRITALTRPGDTSPTLTMAYADGSSFKTQVKQVVDATHNFFIVRNYDGLGRQLQASQQTHDWTAVSAADVLTDYAYDAYGRVVSQSRPHAGSEAAYYTTTSYDVLGRPLAVAAPDGTSTTFGYNGLTTSATDAKGNVTTTTSDIWGRTTLVTPPSGPTVAYTYDELDALKTAVRGGLTTSLNYDKAGRKLNMTDPDMGYWQYGYDALGNLTAQADARGCVLILGYDNLSRLTTKSSGGAGCGTQVSTTYSYDEGANGIGRRTGMTDASGSATWSYDVRGRLTSESKVITGGGTYVTQTAYNSADLITTLTYPDGEPVNYTYNSKMQLNSLIGTSTYLSSAGYDSAGRVTSKALGNGLTQNLTYYAWNAQVSGIGQGGRLNTLVTGTLQNLAYTYDKVGNITQIVDGHAGETSTHTYDAIRRLTSWTLNGAPESYTYGAATGNLATKAGVSYTYGGSHAHAVTALSDGSTYQYDANGNMTQRVVAGQTFNFGYDAENRLVSVSGAATATFVYDGDGNRVQSTFAGTTTNFVGNIYEASGATVTKYYYAGASRVAMRQGSALYYLLSDHLGSTSISTDASGVLVSELRYKPWGEQRYSSGTTPTKYTYTGQYSHTADFGLMYYNARWYDPSLARFAQADTFVELAGASSGISMVLTVSYGETSILGSYGNFNRSEDKTPALQAPVSSQDFDRYGYATNNPVRYNDPTGHCLGVLGGWDTAFCIAGAESGPPGWVADAILVGIELVIIGVAAYNIATAPQPPASTPALEARRRAGGARSLAEHLSMLLGRDVAGSGPHPGRPDPSGRNIKLVVETSAILDTLAKNVEKFGRGLDNFLEQENWTAEQIADFRLALQEFQTKVSTMEAIRPETVRKVQDLVDDLFVAGRHIR